MEICVKNADPVVAYAAAELGRCVQKMTGDAADGGTITLGLFADCGVEPSSLPDANLDDAVHVRVSNGNGCIAGSNPRSVLLGVYRFLREMGCRWVRPGPTGELIPNRSLQEMSVTLDETPSYRHRVVCIEGAVSLSNVLDVVDWLPKVGFNGFYMQFRDGYTFFDRWYSHEDNPRRKRSEPIERVMAQEFTGIVEDEIARRGLLYHAVGHGWHTEAYGVPGIGWMDIHPVPEEFAEKIALVAGRRTVLWGKPMLTALCYSDPEVQQRMVRCIADYAERHRNVDYLHIWLDDCANNKCECERCRTKRTFDFYVQILNALDEELASRGLDTRIVFLAYADLLMPPLEEWIENEDRFTFMYANSRGDYTQPLDPVGDDVSPVSFGLNRMPRGRRKWSRKWRQPSRTGCVASKGTASSSSTTAARRRPSAPGWSGRTSGTFDVSALTAWSTARRCAFSSRPASGWWSWGDRSGTRAWSSMKWPPTTSRRLTGGTGRPAGSSSPRRNA